MISDRVVRSDDDVKKALAAMEAEVEAEVVIEGGMTAIQEDYGH